MASKKSLIPRAHLNGDHTDVSKTKLKLKEKTPKPPLNPPNQTGLTQSNRPPPDDGLLKEDKDAVRRSLLELQTDHERMKNTLEDTVQEAEASLAAMKLLMEERERRFSGRIGSAGDRSKKLEQHMEGYEKALIENNIDPVTGEVLQPTEEQAAQVETVKKVTKKDVTKMREKLQGMNEASDKCLTAVQDIMQDIEEVEATSLRAGGRLGTQNLSKEEMQDLIKEVEEAMRKEELEKKKKKQKKGAVDDEDEEEEEADRSSNEEDEESDAEDHEEEDGEKKEDGKLPESLSPTQDNKTNSKKEVFITSKQ